jgi:murein DD-endopeptidase MepM/ murein hydrolase activator NlpD
VATVVLWPIRGNASLAATGLPSDDQGSSGLGLPTEDRAPAGVAVASADLAAGPKVQLHRDPKSVFLLCPVDPPRHYMDDFGQPRYFGGFHRHQGIDIFAPGGTPIRAPFDGTASNSVSWAGGIQVYLHGKQGFVFNAHLTRVGKMGKVMAGTVIGYVGNTGDAQGGSTHDHFEWHPEGGAAVDSFDLLNTACSKRRAEAQAPAPPPEDPTQLLHTM